MATSSRQMKIESLLVDMIYMYYENTGDIPSDADSMGSLILEASKITGVAPWEKE